MEATWITREYCVGLRTSVCSRFDKRVEQDVRDKDEVVNSIPSTNRWKDRMYESGVGGVFKVFHEE